MCFLTQMVHEIRFGVIKLFCFYWAHMLYTDMKERDLELSGFAQYCCILHTLSMYHFAAKLFTSSKGIYHRTVASHPRPSIQTVFLSHKYLTEWELWLWGGTQRWLELFLPTACCLIFLQMGKAPHQPWLFPYVVDHRAFACLGVPS